MSTNIIQPAFVSGELAPALAARVDVAKYKTGSAVMRNFFVNYQGGASTRPGTRYIAAAKDSGNPVRVVPFRFSTGQTYVLEFGHKYMRVVMNGGLVLASGTTPFVLATPYAGADLFLLKFAQSRDVLTITHPAYPPADLGRLADNNWTLTAITFAAKTTPPSMNTVFAAVGGTTFYRYVVTATDATTGEESLASAALVSNGAATMSVNGLEFMTIGINPQANVSLFNIYRQQEVPNGTPDASELYGLVGSTPGLKWMDRNSVPDFSKTPPLPNDPFANGSIVSITITAGGSGFSAATTVSIASATGAGFRGWPVIVGGAIQSVIIASGGFGYAAGDAVVFTDSGGGSGATAAATATQTASAALSGYFDPGYKGPADGPSGGPQGDGSDAGGGGGENAGGNAP